MEEERAASRREKDQLQDNLERASAGQREAEQLVIDDQMRQQRDIDLYKRIKYTQGYEDHEQGKKPKYSVNDDVEMG